MADFVEISSAGHKIISRCAPGAVFSIVLNLSWIKIYEKEKDFKLHNGLLTVRDICLIRKGFAHFPN